MTDMSVLNTPGPMMMLRPAFPYVNKSGRTNAAVLNHCCVVCGPSLGSSPDTRFGRYVCAPVLGTSTPTAGSRGKPLDLLTIALICQPPRIVAAAPFCAHGLPAPNGSS